jgi:amidase
LGGLFPVDPEVAALTRAAARRFEALGWRVDDECFDASDVPEIVAGTRAFCMTARYAERVERERAAMTPALIAQVSAASQTDLRAVARAERLRTQYWHRVRRFFHAYDHIMLPVAGVAGFRLDGSAPATIGGTPIARFYDVFFATYAFSLVGMPAISIPCGWTNDGLPVGLQIVGPRLREDRVLEAAAAYAALCPEHGARARTIPILG